MKLLVLIGWTISLTAHAALNGGGLDNSGSRRSGAPEVTGIEDTQTGGSIDCAQQETEDNGYSVSYRFLKTLVDQNIPDDEKLEIKKIRGTGNYRVEMNRYVSACTDFEYEMNKTGNNYFLSFKNKYKFSEDEGLLEYMANDENLSQYVSTNDAGERTLTEAWNNTNHDLKHELCLKSKNLVSNNTIDHNRASQNSNYYSRSTTFNTFTVDRGNGEESVNLYFASSKETDYISDGDDVVDAENISPVPDMQCYSYENFAGDNPYRLWTSDKDKIVDRYREACKRGDIEAMMRAQAELSNDGNFQGLLGQMNAITNQLTEQRANDIYATLEEINRELGNSNLDSDEVKSLVDEYLAEVENLDRLVLEPAKRNIRNNILTRRGQTRDQYENNVRPSMDVLERFGRIAGGEHSHVHTALRNNLDSESAELFTDLIREGAEATSHYEAARIALNERRARYRNNPNGEDALENDINDKVDQVIARFERESLNPWRLQYRAYTGDVGVVDNAGATVREIETEINRGFMEFQQSERQGYQQNCGRNMIGMVRNSYGCQQWQQRQQARMQRFMNQREAQLLRLKAARGEFDTLRDVYNEYYRERVASGAAGGDDEEDGFGLVSLTSGQRRTTASELPTLEDGSPIEDYYSFRQQQQQLQQFNPMMMQGQMNPMMMQGQMMNPMMQQQMYMSPMFMQQNPYMMR